MKTIARIFSLFLLLSVGANALTIGGLFTDPKVLDVSITLFNASKNVQERLKLDALTTELLSFTRAMDVDLNPMRELLASGDSAASNAAWDAWAKENFPTEIKIKVKTPVTVTLSDAGYLSLTAAQLAVARNCGLFNIVTPEIDTTGRK